MPKEPFKQRTYKERSQPRARRRFGALEKRKDYLKRASDYKKKQKRLLQMREQAQNRNPDEFAYAMHSIKTKDGIPDLKQEAPQYSADELKLMSEQDSGYLQMRKAIDMKKVEKLQANLHMIGKTSGKHTLFVENEDEAASVLPLHNMQDLLFIPRPEQAAKESMVVGASTTLDPQTLRRLDAQRAKSYLELEQRKSRIGSLTKVISDIELKRQLTWSKGTKIKQVDPTGQAHYKWTTERRK